MLSLRKRLRAAFEPGIEVLLQQKSKPPNGRAEIFAVTGTEI
jgi:hypothetical protein